MAETFAATVRAEEKKVVLVLPRKMDDCIIPWQQAFELAEALTLAAQDIINEGIVINAVEHARECGQIAVNKHRKGNDFYVALFFHHADRISFNPEAARVVARHIRRFAQDCHLEQQKAIRISYNHRGDLTSILNGKNGIRQIIEGR